MKSRFLPTVTQLQFLYLDALSDGFLTGEQLRTKLERCGVCRNPIAFYRVMQRLKKTGLVKGYGITYAEGESPGPHGIYELTQAGEDLLAKTRAFYRKSARDSRRRRRRRKQSIRLHNEEKQSAERAGAYRSERQ
ncbi:replication-relaxation family protein [Gemmatimonadota bacterium]